MKRFFLVVLTFISFYGIMWADEGMWLPSLIYKMNITEMKEMGLELDAEDIYDINNSSLKDAVVALDHGSCTAELISENGLLLTNHHCGFDEIQNHSTVEHDYLKDGFWAMTKDMELPNPGKTVSFLISVDDVTEKVLKEVTDDIDDKERNTQIISASNELEKEAKGDTHYETYVRSFFNNNKYYLFVVETFKDVRLVGAPPQALGKFGGDTDNWMWPRHTADFSMFRIYCGPDGKPAEYSENNIPYQPKYFLPISLKGVEDGDYSMILGYPGRTNRYETSYGVQYTMNVTNPVRVDVRNKKLEILNDYMVTSPKARIQYASKYARSSNYYKYSIGQNKGLKNLNVIAEKKEIEKNFTNWVNSKEERIDKYGDALDLISKAYENTEDDKAIEYMTEAMMHGPEIFVFAYRVAPIFRMLEHKKGSEKRVEMVADKVIESLDKHFKDYNAETDQKLVAALLELYAENNNPKYYPDFFSEIYKKYDGNFSDYAETMFKKTIFDDKDDLIGFFKKPSLKTLKKDMAFQAALDIFEKFRDIGDITDAQNEKLSVGKRLFVAGLMEMEEGKMLYPDANSTMRLTYGKVSGYEPRDAVIYKYYTTTDGYLEKEIPGDNEFDVPKRLKELILARDFGRYATPDGEMRTCFISNNDITGGNSGSPVINRRGELIGIAFDGNWEAMSGDIAFEPSIQRCINVDIRFVLWIIDRYAGASHLIDEMHIVE